MVRRLVFVGVRRYHGAMDTGKSLGFYVAQLGFSQDWPDVDDRLA